MKKKKLIFKPTRKHCELESILLDELLLNKELRRAFKSIWLIGFCEFRKEIDYILLEK